MTDSPIYVHETRVRLRDTDAAGILYFANMLALANEAYEDFLLGQGVTMGALLDEHELVMPVFHTSCDYHHPVRAGDLLRIEMRAPDVRNSGFSLEYRIYREDGKPVATARVVHVVISRATWEKRPIPGDFRAALTGG